MATTTAAAGGVDGAPANLRLTPETYITVGTLLDQNKDFVMPELVKTYGDQGITGFLKLTGAVQSGGTSDEVRYHEAGRRHRTVTGSLDDAATGDQTELHITADGTDGAPIGPNDVLMDSLDGRRYIVIDSNTSSPTTGAEYMLASLDGETAVGSSSTDRKFIVLGNMYGQGTEQPAHFTDADMEKRENPFMIVKDRFQVNGSQATNTGWVDIGGGEYRWFMYGEQEARARFEDRREMMMLFAETGSATDIGDATSYAYNNAQDQGKGSEGYVSALENRGIVVSNANANPLDSFSEFDDIIMELDKNGAPSEYAMYVNRKQDLAIDDMLASGIATGVTAGLAGQFGAFNNDANMAVNLGFKSFTRGGYTFHKHDWKLLNDPTLLGATNYLQGAMIPMSQVADARTGIKAPALAMYHKEAGGYSRELEHWVTGGGVMGHTNNGDAGRDVATFHYRSEVALVTRAANQHVLIKG
jgi:hypothetical protein